MITNVRIKDLLRHAEVFYNLDQQFTSGGHVSLDDLQQLSFAYSSLRYSLEQFGRDPDFQRQLKDKEDMVVKCIQDRK